LNRDMGAHGPADRALVVSGLSYDARERLLASQIVSIAMRSRCVLLRHHRGGGQKRYQQQGNSDSSSMHGSLLTPGGSNNRETRRCDRSHTLRSGSGSAGDDATRQFGGRVLLSGGAGSHAEPLTSGIDRREREPALSR